MKFEYFTDKSGTGQRYIYGNKPGCRLSLGLS